MPGDNRINSSTSNKIEVNNCSPSETKLVNGIARFEKFSSAVDAVFWHMLAKLKLEVVKLDTQKTPIIKGSYTYLNRASSNTKFNPQSKGTLGGEQWSDQPCFFSINDKSFPDGFLEDVAETSRDDTEPNIEDKRGSFNPFHIFAPGKLVLFNKKEEMSNIKHKEIIKELSEKMLQEMESGLILSQPGLFAQFILLCFPDVKGYKFSYWFGFPALLPLDQPHSFTEYSEDTNEKYFSPLLAIFSEKEALGIEKKVQELQSSANLDNADFDKFGGFCLIAKDKNNEIQAGYLTEWDDYLSKFGSDTFIGFMDPCVKDRTFGWPLRNLLYYACQFKKLSNINIISIRQKNGVPSITASSRVARLILHPVAHPSSQPKVVGWEAGTGGSSLAPRLIDISALMDPNERASEAVNLNLQLMRWRAEPRIDLPTIAKSKCLILGAGTLGSYVARNLLAWGVHSITLVDNGKVSFSNPVRQPLYEFKDCLDGGKFKADAAAESLRRVYPKVNVKAYKFTIPMPGHPVSSNEVATTKEDVDTLESLVKSNDIIFMLTDSRESRWLPTLLAARHNKLLLNVALGFDTYMVMRHGMRKSLGTGGHPNLSCYFCQDVVAPTDSLSDRTLDEQCTVTRPGLAPISGATAVELMVSVLQHPLKGLAPAPNQSTSPNSNQLNRLAQVIPHQLRGFLSKFETISVIGQPYPQCSACSNPVLEAYEKDKFQFLFQVFSDPNYLSKVTGLDKLLKEVDDLGELDMPSDSSSWGDGDGDGDDKNYNSEKVIEDDSQAEKGNNTPSKLSNNDNSNGMGNSTRNKYNKEAGSLYNLSLLPTHAALVASDDDDDDP